MKKKETGVADKTKQRKSDSHTNDYGKGINREKDLKKKRKETDAEEDEDTTMEQDGHPTAKRKGSKNDEGFDDEQDELVTEEDELEEEDSEDEEERDTSKTKRTK